MNWGPWDKTGMVSDDVKRQFATPGIQVIPVAAGAAIAVADSCSIEGDGAVGRGRRRSVA